MKRILILSLGALFILGCNKDNKPQENGGNGNEGGNEAGLVEKTFTASLEALTKTSITPTGALTWIRNDQVGVFDSKAQRIFKARSAAESTKLSGEALDEDVYYAVYPYNPDATRNGAVISTILPETQTAVKADEVGYVGLAAAKNSGETLAFKNLSGAFAFTPGADDITSVEIRATGFNIAGKVDIDLSAAPALSVTEGASAIVVRPAAGSFEKGKVYYVAALPASGITGLVVLSYIGNNPILTQVSGSVDISASGIVELGTVGVESGDETADILGKWKLVRYGSRAATDVDGAYIWWSDKNEKPLDESADDILTFKADGVLEISAGADGKSKCENGEAFTPSLNNPGWTIVKEGNESYMKFSGGAYPLMLPSPSFVNEKWHIVTINSGGIQLEIERNNDGEDGWFQVVLQPVGIKSFSRHFLLGDFGIDSTDANEGWYNLNIDAHNGKSTFDGFEWNMAVDVDEVYYVYSNCIRVGIGWWRESEYTPNQVTFSTSDIPGSIKSVYIMVSHNNDRDEADVDVKATVGGQPFGAPQKVVHNDDGPLTYTFASPLEASGAIAIDIVHNKGNYGLYISEIGVNYQE